MSSQQPPNGDRWRTERLVEQMADHEGRLRSLEARREDAIRLEERIGALARDFDGLRREVKDEIGSVRSDVKDEVVGLRKVLIGAGVSFLIGALTFALTVSFGGLGN